MTTPAAIVSPLRLISTRPISLLSAAVSSGIEAVRREFGADRSVISTKAVVPFCSTLTDQPKVLVVFQLTYLGFFLMTCPFSEIDSSLVMFAGRFMEWWNSSTCAV
jgi:hypothetical protein